MSSLITIEPHQLWLLRILNKLSLITKTDFEKLLREYLENLPKTITQFYENANALPINKTISPEEEKESDSYLITLDPTKWKDQDHYMVLGLQRLRYLADDDDIRKAHRRKALKHHPDKRGKSGEDDPDSDYYACITRAMDILSDPIKRRSYDSVDPTFDDTIPNPLSAQKLEKNPKQFYSHFYKAFELNSRWSVKKNVPLLGNENSDRNHVEKFYSFWYGFESWREYSYLDEEDKEKGENREERRWLDKQNKSVRQQRKKEEMQRIMQLVDNAFKCDPRISKFKEDDKNKKLEQKRAKQEAIKQKHAKEEAERIRKEEEIKKREQAQEDEEKAKRLVEKKAKESAKKQLKKVVKSLEDYCRGYEYFIIDLNEKVRHLEELDKLCKLTSIEDLIKFRDCLQALPTEAEKRELFLDYIKRMNDKIADENRQSIENKCLTNGNSGQKKNLSWDKDEIKLLIKAVSLFPAGTKDRWDVVSKYLAQHNPEQRERDAKQVLTKVKELQQTLVRMKQ